MDDSIAPPAPGHALPGSVDALRAAIRRDHERTSLILEHFRHAWLEGDTDRARARFHRFQRELLRHLGWEEAALVCAFRDRLLEHHHLEAVSADCVAHRELRTTLTHIEVLLPSRCRGDLDLDRRILELVEMLDRGLDAHRERTEMTLCDALEGVITPAECDDATRSIARQPATCD